MNIGEFIEWFQPERLDFHMRHMSGIWYEPACFYMDTLCQQLGIDIYQLDYAFHQFEEEQQTKP